MAPIGPLDSSPAAGVFAMPTAEARLAALVESADDAIIGASLGGVIETWNPGAERMFGYAAAEAIRRPLGMLAPPDRPDEVGATLDRLRRGEPGARLEVARRRKDGSLVEVCVTVSPVSGGPGAVAGAALVARDVTERNRAQEALRRSEERYRLLVQASTDVVWCTDDGGNVRSPRPSWEAYTGQRWSEYAGWGWLPMLHPDDRDRMRAAWERMRASPGPTTVEIRLWHAASKRHRYCVAHGLPLQNGRVREWVGTIADVDDRR